MKRAPALLLAAVLAAGPLAADEPVAPIDVYVFAAPELGGFVTQALKERQGVVDGLAASFYRFPLTRLVTSKEAARMLIEVISVGEQETGREKSQPTLMAKLFRTGERIAEKEKQTSVTVRLRLGDYSTEFVGKSKQDGSKETLKATQAAITLMQAWIRDNYARIVPSPSPSPSPDPARPGPER